MISDLFPRPGELRDRHADAAVAALAAAVSQDAAGPVDPRLVPYVERIRQAEQKIAAGLPVKRIAELMALLQFGAGSAGRAVADACGASEAVGACEAQFIADGLVSIVARSPDMPHIVPDDLRRRHAGDGDANDALDAALRDLLGRAAAALPAPAASGHRGLDLFLARRAALCARRIARLRRRGPRSGRGELTAVDRAFVRLRLLCRRLR